MEYPKWVWISLPDCWWQEKFFFAYFVRRGAPASPTFASARTWLEGEFLKICWTYAYRIHTYMESSEKFHISMKRSILIWNSYSYGQQHEHKHPAGPFPHFPTAGNGGAKCQSANGTGDQEPFKMDICMSSSSHKMTVDSITGFNITN